MSKQKRPSERGVAIILVIFVVALASILVVNLSYSTILESRSLGMVERQLQAEYIIKSIVSFGSELIYKDADPKVDTVHDNWGIFLRRLDANR